MKTFHWALGLISLAMAGGWIANIVKLLGVEGGFSEWGTMEVVRIIGIFMLPIGGVLGFV